MKLRSMHERAHACMPVIGLPSPGTLSRVKQWLSFGEYLHRRFLGRSVCSLSMASGTGMLQTHARTWDTVLIHALTAHPEQFPFLGDLDEHVRIASRDILPDGLLTQRDLPPMLPWNSRTLWLCWLY